jgi:hypothetical protein
MTVDTKFSEQVKESIKSYLHKSDTYHDVADSIAEFYSIIAGRLGIYDRVTLYVVISIMFRVAYIDLINKKNYDTKEKSEIIVRNMLFMVGEENERLVKILGMHWALPNITDA